MAEIADGAGGYLGISNWVGQDVPAMWRKLADQQTDSHWKVAAGWRKAFELTSTHLSRVKQYRESLVAAWPPSKSQAAQAYVARLDHLIDSLQQTYDAASANYTTFSAATTAISTSRAQLQRINEEYTAKLAQKQFHDEQTASLRKAGFTGVYGKPPVTNAELEQLNNKARTIMYGLSGELVQAQAQIRQPPPYRRGGVDPDPTEVNAGGSTAPIIPPIVPVPAPRNNAGTSPKNSSVERRAAVPAPTARNIGPVLGGSGPVLGSAGTLAPHSPAVPTPIMPSAPPTTSGAGFSPGVPPGLGLPGRQGGLGRPVTGSPALMPESGPFGKGLGATARFGGEVAATPRALPPGGLIGGGVGPGLGHPAAGGAQARRVNPVGGVIGGGAGTAPSGGAGQRPGQGSGRSPMGAGGQAFGGMPPDRSTGRPDKNQSGRRWNPDNPWETDEGVPPVVLPPDEPGGIDPGPAIGLDR